MRTPAGGPKRGIGTGTPKPTGGENEKNQQGNRNAFAARSPSSPPRAATTTTTPRHDRGDRRRRPTRGGDRATGGAPRHRPRPKHRPPPRPRQRPRPRRRETTAATEVAPEDIATDIGVDDTTIKVGMLADLSGAFAPLVTEIVEAQKVFWDTVNADGGIAGRQVELVVEDNGYDVAMQQEKYEAIRDEVAILSQSTGSPHTAAIAPGLVDDDLIAIPLSWYSGWAFGEIGQNAFESYTNYCFESMNALEWLSEEPGGADGRDHLVPR